MKPASFVVDDLLVHHVAKHQGQIRRNVSQFNEARAKRVKIRIIGGGPAGLFFAYLMGRADAGHDVRVYERDPEGATYGWGLVFSDVALSFVREIAPEVYDSITSRTGGLRRHGDRAPGPARHARRQHLPSHGADRSAERAAPSLPASRRRPPVRPPVRRRERSLPMPT